MTEQQPDDDLPTFCGGFWGVTAMFALAIIALAIGTLFGAS